MLILKRKVGESLVVGDDVTGTVLAIKNKQVRIGIDAPNEVAVHREESYDRNKVERCFFIPDTVPIIN